MRGTEMPKRRRKRYIRLKRYLRYGATVLLLTLAVFAAVRQLHGPSSSNEGWRDMTEREWNLTLVNRWNPLPENFDIKLVEVEGGQKVDERIYEPLMEMLKDAEKENEGAQPRVVSGYRTEEKQRQLYDDKIDYYQKQGYPGDKAEELAGEWVALPGHSEHQLGLAVDINGEIYDLYSWLQENSYKYGFIFRYPDDKSDITGTAEEVWHYRYVGKEAAKEIYEQGVCLEEYLQRLEEKPS